jgi:hypothetical protein
LRDNFDTYIGDVPARCVVWGMPGLGKTQLALKYARSTFDGKQYLYIFWVSASSIEKVKSGFSNILDLVCYPGRASLGQASKLTAARLWLESSTSDSNKRWLLVLDNVNEDVVTSLREILPKRNCNGHLLFTTRTKAVAQSLAMTSGAQHDILALKQPSTDDAVTLLLSSTGKKTTDDSSVRANAKDIVNSVGCLPLAVDQASSFMNASGCSAPELLEIYKSEQIEQVTV